MRNDFQDSLHLRMPSFQHQIWIGNVYHSIKLSQFLGFWPPIFCVQAFM